MRAAGFDAHVFDLDDGYTGLDDRGLAALASATHVLATVPPVADFDRDPLLALHGDALAAEDHAAALGGLPLDDERLRRPRRRLGRRARRDARAGGRPRRRAAAGRARVARAARAQRRPAGVARLPPRRHLRAGALGAAHGRALRRHERRRRARRGAPTTTRRRRRCSATSAPSAPTGWRPSTSRASTSPTLAPRSSRRWRRPPRARTPPCTTSATTSRRRGFVMAHAAHLLGLPLTEEAAAGAPGERAAARARRAQARRQPPDARRAAAARPRVPELPRGAAGGDRRGHLDFQFKPCKAKARVRRSHIVHVEEFEVTRIRHGMAW